MKKLTSIITLLVVLFAIGTLYAGNTHAVSVTPKEKPYGLKVYDLHTRNTSDSDDTLAAANDCNFYGPYELCSDGDAQPTSFILQADAITGTTPVMAFDYQLIVEGRIQDTLTWTAADTLNTSIQNASHTMTGKGNFIIFRVNNYDATASQVPGMLRVLIPSATTVQKVKK